MRNIFLSILIWTMLVAGSVGYAASWIFDAAALNMVTNFFIQLFVLSSIYYLLHNGMFLRTNQFWICISGVVILTIGTLFKIMHWPGNAYLIVLGGCLITGAYLWYMIQQQHLKTHILKFLFVLLFVSGGLITMLGGNKDYGYVLRLLAIVVLVSVVIPQLRKK